MMGVGEAVTVPPVPPGPGVQPPFAAPPTDGEGRRRSTAITLSIVAALVLCLGGAGGFVALIVLGQRVLEEQSQTALTNYLTALRDQRYVDAYAQLCDPLQDRTSEEQFVRLQRSQPRVSAFEVGKPEVADGIIVPASVTTVDGFTRSERFMIYQDTKTGGVEVCGTAD